MVFKGSVVAITKVKNDEGMAVRITMTGGIFLEVSNIHEEATFKILCALADLGKTLSISVKDEK
jgi:hypothetical protein